MLNNAVAILLLPVHNIAKGNGFCRNSSSGRLNEHCLIGLINLDLKYYHLYTNSLIASTLLVWGSGIHVFAVLRLPSLHTYRSLLYVLELSGVLSLRNRGSSTQFLDNTQYLAGKLHDSLLASAFAFLRLGLGFDEYWGWWRLKLWLVLPSSTWYK